MDRANDHDWATMLAAAQAWWREAGVEHAFADAPRDWLEGARKATEAPTPRPRTAFAAPERVQPPRIGGERTRWPETLAQFADWWLTEPSLDPTSGGHRVLPAGPAGAPLMVLVPQPEPGDREILLGGAQGRLLDAMLAAFGLTRPAAYVASVLPRPTPLADWAALGAAGMGEVVAHHIALATPQRVLVFGRDRISPLLGHDPAQGAAASREFNHGRGSVVLAFAPALETLLERPARKQGVWAQWLDWTRTG